MQLSTEVLPAPFGPIRATSSPGFASRLTSSNTFSPPNASDTERSASSAIPAAAAAVLLDVAVAAPLPARAAEVELADVLVREELLRRAVEHDAAVLHDVGIVGGVERDLRVLLDQQDGDAGLGANRLQASHEFPDEERREPLRELVDEQELG